MPIKNAIHIITHKSDIDYTCKLLDSVYKKTIGKVPQIFIFVDSEEEKKFLEHQLLAKNIKLAVTCLSMSEVMQFDLGIEMQESLDDARSSSFNYGRWSANNNRDWVAIKRSYTLLYLHSIGFSHVWCLDSESFFLNSISIEELFRKNSDKPGLFVNEDFDDKNLVRFPYESWMLSLFGYELDPLKTLEAQNVGLRQNDF